MKQEQTDDPAPDESKRQADGFSVTLKQDALEECDNARSPMVRGTRLYLREVRQSDVTERYYRWLQDPEVNRYLETRFVLWSLEKIAEYVSRMDGKQDEVFFAICTLEDDEHIGNIKVGPINRMHQHADVSLLIGEKQYWGKGYATEAIALATRYAFETLNLNKLKAGCYAENEGSARAFEKCGYRREGLLRGHYFINGSETDAVQLGLRVADYWEQVRK